MELTKIESTQRVANLLDLSKETSEPRTSEPRNPGQVNLRTREPPEQELADRVRQLQTHVTQLQNVIAKSKSQERKSHSQQRAFDFTKYNVRHVALKIAYLGWDYQGFAAQEDTNRTIEAVLFDALIKTRLIEARETSNYHRCGRTDKGVSAFSQVISIDLRTNLLEGKGVKVREGGTATERPGDKTVEIRYIHILNKVLPHEIRVLAWCPVEPEFSARFSCKRRMYKYYFPRGNLNLDKMANGARRLVGDNDYRNLCKMDVANGVVKFKRTILSVDLKLCEFPSTSRHSSNLLPAEDDMAFKDADGSSAAETGESDGKSFKNGTSAMVPADELSESAVEGNPVVDDGVGIRNIPESSYDMCELTVVGNAFLWHQIRCIVAILLLIGEDKESPEVITELLNVEKNPQKPQYSMASELPLVLFDCDFDDVEWLHDSENREETIEQLQEMWMKHSVKATMLRGLLNQTTLTSDSRAEEICCQAMGLIPGNRVRKYKPLLDRERCDSLEDRVKHYSKKRKLDLSNKSDDG